MGERRASATSARTTVTPDGLLLAGSRSREFGEARARRLLLRGLRPDGSGHGPQRSPGAWGHLPGGLNMTSLLIHIVLPIHIVAGGVGLVSGAAALFATKGARLHRKSGMLFVCAMVALAVTGGEMAALQGDELTACVGLLSVPCWCRWRSA